MKFNFTWNEVVSKQMAKRQSREEPQQGSMVSPGLAGSRSPRMQQQQTQYPGFFPQDTTNMQFRGASTSQAQTGYQSTQGPMRTATTNMVTTAQTGQVNTVQRPVQQNAQRPKSIKVVSVNSNVTDTPLVHSPLKRAKSCF